jgi:hypothetical protein
MLVRDRRTRQARYVESLQEQLTEAIGGDPSPQQALIIRRASFKALRCSLSESTMIANNGNTPESLKESYLKWSRELREDLRLLGLKRMAKDVTPNLKEWFGESE